MTEDNASPAPAPTDEGGQPADANLTMYTLPPRKAPARRKVATRKTPAAPAAPADTVIHTDNGEDAAVAKVTKPRVRKAAAPKAARSKETAPAETMPAVRDQSEVSAPVARQEPAPVQAEPPTIEPSVRSREPQPMPVEAPRATEERPAPEPRSDDRSEPVQAREPSQPAAPSTPMPFAPVLPAAPDKSPPDASTPEGLVAPSPSVAMDNASPGGGPQGPAVREPFQPQDRQGRPDRPDDQQRQGGRFNRQDRHGRRDRFQQGGNQGNQGQGNQGGQRDFQGGGQQGQGQRDFQGGGQGQGPRDFQGGNQGQGQRDFQGGNQGQGQRDFQGQGQRDGREPRNFQGQGNRDFRNDGQGQGQGDQSQGGNDGFVSRVVEPTFGEGIVEVSGKGFGFLREAKRNFVQTPADIFVTPEVCRKYNLRDGQWIKGEVRRSSRGPQLFRLIELNGEDPEKFKNLPNFEELTTINPKKRIRLETTADRYTTRVMDLMTPIGKGQRGLIVAPPRTGKTTLLQHIGEAVIKNHPEIKLIILLVDERPEEVTEIRRALPQAEIMASSNDSDLKSHVRIAQLAMERCKRLVEAGFDVFMLLDSITRMGRAFNNASAGGRTGSGGIDNRALEIPRKIFAAARNTEEAGSLTIMATALIETGSRGDEVIFQEFKGTGNMELVLDRKISDQRIYPAVDIFQSGTRREELLLQPWELDKINVIRRGLAGHKPLEAIERLLSFLKKFPTNAQMLTSLPG